MASLPYRTTSARKSTTSEMQRSFAKPAVARCADGAGTAQNRCHDSRQPRAVLATEAWGLPEPIQTNPRSGGASSMTPQLSVSIVIHRCRGSPKPLGVHADQIACAFSLVAHCDVLRAADHHNGRTSGALQCLAHSAWRLGSHDD